MKALITAAVLAIIGTSATAATCKPTLDVYQILKDRYGEERVSGGFTEGGLVLIETWANALTGSFTILATNKQGASCVAASGSGFAIVAKPNA